MTMLQPGAYFSMSVISTSLIVAQNNGWIAMAVLLAINMVMIIGFIFLLIRFYYICPPDRVIVRTGVGAMKFAGGAGMWVIPVMHRAQLLSLQPMRIELSAAATSNRTLPRCFTVAIEQEAESLYKAATHLAGLTTDEIKQHAADLIADVFSRHPSDVDAVEHVEQQIRDALAPLGLEILSMGYNSHDAASND